MTPDPPLLRAALRPLSRLEWALATRLPEPWRGPPRPQFLGIGAQKAGTTWLHDNLAHHPDLYLPPEKEVHYFDTHRHRPLRWYRERFRAGAGRICGEITPAYATLPPFTVSRIARVWPDLRVVMLLRDPVARAWSQVVMNEGLAGRDVRELSDRALIALLERPNVRLRGDYRRALTTWEAALPGGVHVAFFEQIREDPEGLLADVLLHLGARVPPSWSGYPLREVSNRGGGVPMPPAVRRHLQARYASDLQWLRGRFGHPVARWGDGA